MTREGHCLRLRSSSSASPSLCHIECRLFSYGWFVKTAPKQHLQLFNRKQDSVTYPHLSFVLRHLKHHIRVSCSMSGTCSSPRFRRSFVESTSPRGITSSWSRSILLFGIGHRSMHLSLLFFVHAESTGECQHGEFLSPTISISNCTKILNEALKSLRSTYWRRRYSKSPSEEAFVRHDVEFQTPISYSSGSRGN